MNDLISRQDAIEAVRTAEHRFTVADEQHGMGTVKWDMYGVYTAFHKDVLVVPVDVDIYYMEADK